MTTRHTLFDEMSELVRQFDTLLERAFGETRLPIGRGFRRPLLGPARATTELGTGRTLPSTLPETAWTTYFYPQIECFRREKELVLRAELPGVDPEKIDIDVDGDRLTIRGEKTTKKEVKETDYYMQETGYGRFERSFTMPEGVKADQIKADFSNGVLEIRIPYEAKAPTKKVPIEVKATEKKPVKAA